MYNAAKQREVENVEKKKRARANERIRISYTLPTTFESD